MKNYWRRLFSIGSKISPWTYFLVFSFFFIANQHYDYIAWKTLGNTPFHSDAATYYCYLPAWFIHLDLGFHFPNNYKLIAVPGGNLIPGYTLGVSLMEAPFFLIGHLIAHLFHYAQDGYSAPYIWSVYFGTIAYVIAGLRFLYRMLISIFKPLTAVFTVFSIFYASNLFFYSVCEGQMSHAYSFFWYCVFIYAFAKLYLSSSAGMVYLLACAAGFITLIRPTDVLVLFIPLLAGFPFVKGWKAWWVFLWKIRMYVLGGALVFILILSPQLLFWKIQGGSFLIDTYPGQHFFFADPKISYFLFSYRKGLFLYTPVMILAFIGFGVLYVQEKEWFWPLLIYLGISIYVLSSWWDWSYSGSFGSRAMIENYAVLAIPLSAFFEFMLNGFQTSWKKTLSRISCVLLVWSLSTLNLSMSVKYKDAIIHWSGMTREAYWYIMRRETFDDRDRALIQKMLKEPDPRKQLQGLRDE